MLLNLLETLGFRKKRLPEGELLSALLAVRRHGDMRRFAKLCLDHAEVIIAAIPRWKKAPEALMGNPQALGEYVQTLTMVAELLRNSGHPELWISLVGNPDDNPVMVWERKLKEASSLADGMRFDEAAELLMNHLIDARHLRGNAIGRLQALSQGSLGHMRFSSGKVNEAIGHYEQALSLCREQQDLEGVCIYLSSLYESHRYLGKTGLAADYAQRLRQAWVDAGDNASAKRFARLSQMVRDGEPALRVVVHHDGKVLELDEVEFQPAMNLKMQFWRNRPSLPGATMRIQRGKAMAGKQQYEEALELFRDAAKIDPCEPDAHYQSGMVLCEQRLYAQAVEEYETCESLAPGWFFCRSDLWVARQLALGVIAHEIFLGMRFLQDGPPDAKEKMNLANKIRPYAESVPLFALLFGKLLQEAGRSNEAAEVWCKAIADGAEPDVQTQLLVSLSALEQDANRRRQLLQQAVALNGNLVAAAGAALSLRFGQ